MNARISRLVALVATMLLLATPASAQTPTPSAGTITVTASGTASAPADSALVVITLGTDTSVMPVEPYDAAATSPTPSTETIDPQPVIDALVAQGVPQEDIAEVVPPFAGEWGGIYGPLPVSITFSLDQPDVEFLRELLQTTLDTAHANGWLVNTFGVLYEVADCAPLYRQARANAVTNAEAAAADQAAALESSLGEPIGSRDNTMFGGGFPTANCGADPTTLGMAKIYAASAFDPAAPAEVSVTIWLDVTFDLP